MNRCFLIRAYQEQDELEWLDLHASIMVDSYAWWIVLHKKPSYKGEVVDLVVEENGTLLAFLTMELTPDFLDTSHGPSAFVWEFGVHREHRLQGIGRMLIRRGHEILAEKGIYKSIWYSQDPQSQKFYEKMGMKEFDTHMQFAVYPTPEQKELFTKDGFDCWYMRGSSSVENYTWIKERYRVVEEEDALKPRLCIGYELIWPRKQGDG